MPASPANTSHNLHHMKNCARPTCKQQNPQPYSSFTKNRTRKDGHHQWCKYCVRENDRKRHPARQLHKCPYVIHKKDHCELCPFVAKHPCQLDVDHIDGNHKNNEINNLMTLCANCHRYKTQVNKDFLKRKPS